MKEERELGTDPTEARQENCTEFTGGVANWISKGLAVFNALDAVWDAALQTEREHKNAVQKQDVPVASRACRDIAHYIVQGYVGDKNYSYWLHENDDEQNDHTSTLDDAQSSIRHYLPLI
jgi:hypothetical protein